MALDREMLATDLAELLSRDEYGINVDSADVKRGLDAFLKAVEPVKVTDAARRVGAFVELYAKQTAHRHDEIAALDDMRLLTSDLRALLRAVGTEAYTRSLREKLATRGRDSGPITANGVEPIKCSTCQGPAHLFCGNVQVHLTPGGLPCTGAGQAYKAPERRASGSAVPGE